MSTSKIQYLAVILASLVVAALTAAAQTEKAAPGSRQWTEGTILGNVGPDKKYSYVVIKDAQGKEHQFIVLKYWKALTPFLSGPEYYVGKRKRVQWQFDTHPDTGEKVKAALAVSD